MRLLAMEASSCAYMVSHAGSMVGVLKSVSGCSDSSVAPIIS